ncbi:MAG: hypothetical protein HOE69_06895 [Euryarchaeota archaeon]|nr:hypothetical protein [Euryarchaeota archaeon]
MRPAHVRQGVVAVAVALLGLLLVQGVWFEVSAYGTYLEGPSREPTIWANYSLDSEQEHIDIEITNATPLIVYLNTRENIGEAGEVNVTSTLDDTRELVQKGVILTVAFFALGSYRRWFSWLGFGMWGFTAFLLIVMVPMSLFGGYSDDSGPEARGALETGDEVGDNQFAHSTFNSSLSLHSTGLNFGFDSSGYDLGLVNASQRDAVRENPPEDGEEGAEAFIRFAGEVSISFGEGIIAWLAVPIIPLVFLIIGRVNVDISNQVASIEDSESE